MRSIALGDLRTWFCVKRVIRYFHVAARLNSRQRKFNPRTMAVIALMMCVSCASSPQRPASVHNLEQIVPELMGKHAVPGMSSALIREGKVYWVKSFGVRDGHVPVTNRTIFEAHSLSK